jgi:hypothetical protein
MMRPFAVVNSWQPNQTYQAGNVIAFRNVDYRARVTHTSQSFQGPDDRFDLWDRVNNNNGTWQPQIRYALNDRVLFNGQLFVSRGVFQAQVGQTPPNNPGLWQRLPNDACGQFAQFCQGNSNPTAVQCLADGQAGVETKCLAEVEPCLSVCQPQQATPCSGLCNNPIRFSVADGSTFNSGPLGESPVCFETVSRLFRGSSSNFESPRTISINGRPEPIDANFNYPLPPMRNDGYCIQISGGEFARASFTAF